jgi:excisionase family DNA binding protein
MDRDVSYTVPEAAKVLGISQTRVRQLLREGQIAGTRTDNMWEVSKHSVHSFRDTYEPKGKAKDSETLPIEAREAMDDVKDLTFRLGRIEGRLELEAVARSTLEVQLQREQERADQERLERIQAQEEARKLREELEAQRTKGFWRKLFGG